MAEYRVMFEERRSKEFTINADSLVEAEALARRKVNTGVLKLGKEDITDQVMEIENVDGMSTTGIFSLTD